MSDFSGPNSWGGMAQILKALLLILIRWEHNLKMSCSLLVNQGRWPEAPVSPQEFLKCSFLAVKTAFHIQEKYGGLISGKLCLETVNFGSL